MDATPALAHARRLWMAAEPLHAVVYFAPETIQAAKDTGLKGFWMGYFAGRAAPMGPVAPDVVTATFFNFHPAMVRRALPDAWALADPAAVLAARIDGATRALRRLLPDATAPTVLARQACELLGCEGRPLAAAWRAVPWTGDELADLWLACTMLREHRGDGHVCALLSEELSGCDAHVLAVAAGSNTRESLQPNRGWSDEEWDASGRRLRARDWVDAQGALTALGREAVARIEARTDQLALAPLRALGQEAAERLLAGLAPLAEVVRAAGEIPFPNAMGLPRR